MHDNNHLTFSVPTTLPMIFFNSINYTCNYYWVVSGFLLFTERTGRQGIWSLYRPFSGKQRTGSDPSPLYWWVFSETVQLVWTLVQLVWTLVQLVWTLNQGTKKTQRTGSKNLTLNCRFLPVLFMITIIPLEPFQNFQK